MTTHLSARLAWHDRGWDGRVCDAPHLNAHCIVHQHICDSRDDEKERRFAGTALSELDGWLPPCSRDPAAYSSVPGNDHQELRLHHLAPGRETGHVYGDQAREARHHHGMPCVT